jgi:WD40 repeat protein
MSLVFRGNDQLATAGSDNLVHIWDLNTRTKIAELAGHTGTVAVLACHQDLLVSAGFDTTVRTWKLRPGYPAGNGNGPNRIGSFRRELESR